MGTRLCVPIKDIEEVPRLHKEQESSHIHSHLYLGRRGHGSGRQGLGRPGPSLQEARRVVRYVGLPRWRNFISGLPRYDPACRMPLLFFFFSLKKPRIQKNNIKHKSGQHEAQARPAGPWTKFENSRLGTACHYPKPGPCPAKVCEAIHPLSIRITRERAHFKLDLLNKNHYWTKSCKRIKKLTHVLQL